MAKKTHILEIKALTKEWNASIENNPVWISLEPEAGEDYGIIKLFLNSAETTDQRQAIIKIRYYNEMDSIGYKEVKIMQEGLPELPLKSDLLASVEEQDGLDTVSYIPCH